MSSARRWDSFHEKCGSNVELSNNRTSATSSAREDSTVFVPVSIGEQAEIVLKEGSIAAVGVTVADPQKLHLPGRCYALPKSSVLVSDGNFYINGTRANPPCEFVRLGVGERIGIRVESRSRFTLLHNGVFVAEIPTGDTYTVVQPMGEVTTIACWDGAEQQAWLVVDLEANSRVSVFIDPVLRELKRTKEDLENKTAELRDLGDSYGKVLDELNTFKRTAGDLEGEREKMRMKQEAKGIQNIDQAPNQLTEIKTILEDFLQKMECQNKAFTEKEKTLNSEKITKLIKSQSSFTEKQDTFANSLLKEIIAAANCQEESVWFVENDKLILQPLNDKHVFYTGNCYLIWKRGKLYAWVGAESSLDKRLFIQKNALNLYQRLRNGTKNEGDNMSILEMEPLSTELVFINQNGDHIFNDQKLKGGGIPSVPKHTPRMYEVEESENLKVVAPKWANLDHHNVFILDVGSFIFLWSGRYSSYEQQQVGQTWAHWCKANKSDVTIVKVKDDEEEQLEIGEKEWNVFFPPENKGEIGRNKTKKILEKGDITLRKVVYEILKGKDDVDTDKIDMLFNTNSVGDIIESLQFSTLIPSRNGDIFQVSLLQLAILYKSTYLLQRILQKEDTQGYEKNIGHLLSDTVKMYHILDSDSVPPCDIITPKRGSEYELLEEGKLAKGMNAFQLASSFNPEIISSVFEFKQKMKQPRKDIQILETNDIKTILDATYEYKPASRLHVFDFQPFLDLQSDDEKLEDVPISSSFLTEILESENAEVQSHLVVYMFNSCLAPRLTLLFISWLVSVCFAWSSGQLGLSIHRGQVPSMSFFIITAALVIIMIMVEMIRMIWHYRLEQYWRGRENWLQWTVIVISVIFLVFIPISNQEENFESQTNQTKGISAGKSSDVSSSNDKMVNILACFCVFGAYAIAILLMSKTKTFGIYIIMLVGAAKKTLALLLIYFNIISAFSYAFILLIDKSEDVFGSSMYEVFNRILAMMIGELDYSDSFKPDPSPAKQIVIQLMFTMFLIAIPILLCNLLIGLTTNDVQKLYKDAILYQCQNRLQEIIASKARIKKRRRLVCIKEPLRPFKPGYDDVLMWWHTKEEPATKRMAAFCVLIYRIGLRFMYPTNPEPLVLLYEFKTQSAEEGQPMAKLPLEFVQNRLTLMGQH